jgi:hypothetical protein
MLKAPVPPAQASFPHPLQFLSVVSGYLLFCEAWNELASAAPRVCRLAITLRQYS